MTTFNDNKNINDLIRRVVRHEQTVGSAVNLTPSENVISPLARMPFALDAYSRYFLDDMRLFGSWFFVGGRHLGNIEKEVLIPLMREMTQANFVNVRPISGLHCMTAAIAALTRIGDTMLVVPVECGGHVSTRVVATRLGLDVQTIPFCNEFDIDYEKLEADLSKSRPRLIYIDQSTLLFPIDPTPIREIIESVSPGTLLHYDSSHLNGLILCNAIFNPLERGADSFGGSTHKTLPGPHKGFLATNNKELDKMFTDYTDHFVSHHHMAEVISLAITLLEMKNCGGETYASETLKNAKKLATALDKSGVQVASADRGFTESHQVWITPDNHSDASELVESLARCGLIVNKFNGLPGIASPSFRLSTAEATRLGASEVEMQLIANIIGGRFTQKRDESELLNHSQELRSKLGIPRYCYSLEDLELSDFPPRLKNLIESIFNLFSDEAYPQQSI